MRRNRTVVFSPDNLSQIFAVSAHQFGRELISRPPNAKLWGISFVSAFGDFPTAAQEQNDEADTETNAGIAAA